MIEKKKIDLVITLPAVGRGNPDPRASNQAQQPGSLEKPGRPSFSA
jgi:hypothetical protein